MLNADRASTGAADCEVYQLDGSFAHRTKQTRIFICTPRPPSIRRADPPVQLSELSVVGGVSQYRLEQGRQPLWLERRIGLPPHFVQGPPLPGLNRAFLFVSPIMVPHD